MNNTVDVNGSTECTGAVVSPWWVITSRSCLCGDQYGCKLARHNDNDKYKVFVYPGFRYIKSR